MRHSPAPAARRTLLALLAVLGATGCASTPNEKTIAAGSAFPTEGRVVRDQYGHHVLVPAHPTMFERANSVGDGLGRLAGGN